MKKLLPFIIAVLLASCGNRSKPKDAASALSKLPVSPTPEASYDNPVKTLGIGLVKAPNQFSIYEDSLLSKKFRAVDMNQGKVPGLAPKYCDTEYGIMHFVCISETNKAYKVLTDSATQKYLPKLKGYDFVSWANYITQSSGIRRISSKKGTAPQGLNSTPDDNAKQLPIPQGHEMFCPMLVKGDWVSVTYDCFYNDDNSKHEGEPCQKYIGQCKSPVTGWLRWRKANKVLIDILFD